jgi:lipoprotein LprG
MPLAFCRWLLPFLLGFLLLAAGCRGGSTAAERPEPGEILRRAAEAVDRATAFHFLLEHQNGSTPIVLDLQMDRAEGDIVKPDRMQADIIARLRGVTARSTVVVVGDRAWMTNPFTQMFQALPAGTTLHQIFDPGTGVSRVVGSLQNARLAGEERVDGVECYVVQGQIDSGELRAVAPTAEAGRSITVRAHIGKEDFLPRRVRLEGAMTAAEPSNIIRTVSLSRFNEHVTIAPPP